MRFEPGFPKTMKHPAHAPAVISNSRNPSTAFRGSPERFPTVWVNNSDQQEYYESRGYRVTHTS